MSPFNLIQEQVPTGPNQVWGILVACTLLNRTHGRQVRPMYHEFMKLCPSPQAMLALSEGDQVLVKALLRPLGFGSKRWAALRMLAKDLMVGEPIPLCHGVGKYALDSVAIFVDDRTDVETDDGWLKTVPRLEKA